MASIIIGIPFIIWDEFFTLNKVWGFNENYLVGFGIGHLPIEEISFFIVVPFACTFIYECVVHYFRNVNLNKFNVFFLALLLGYAVLVFVQNPLGWYTISSISLGLIVLFLSFRLRNQYSSLPTAFLISLVPFLIINGILTGYGIEDQIVWYNQDHFSGLRIITIPFEDVLYSWSLVALNIMVFERLKAWKYRKSS